MAVQPTEAAPKPLPKRQILKRTLRKANKTLLSFGIVLNFVQRLYLEETKAFTLDVMINVAHKFIIKGEKLVGQSLRGDH